MIGPGKIAQRERERETDRQTDRQRQRQIYRETETERQRQIYRETETERETHRETETERPYAVHRTLKSNYYNTIQPYCLCVGKIAFWLVIYIEHSIHFTIKHQQFNKTSTIQ